MSKNSSKYPKSPGVLKPSQLITTFGPGSIVQVLYDSVMVMGLQSWSTRDKDYIELHHPFLQAVLKTNKFKMPISVEKQRVIPCTSFPRWGVCSNKNCNRLQKHQISPKIGSNGFQCDVCHYPLFHARFIVVCPYGHVDEFPWEEWAHMKTETGKLCDKPMLKFYGTGYDPGLANYFVECENCHAEKVNVGNAVDENGLKGLVDKCSGYTPWLGLDRYVKNCKEKPRGVQTRSTNVYFSVSSSAIFVPKWLNPIQQRIDEKASTITDYLREEGENYLTVAKKRIFEDIRNEDKKWTPEVIAEEIKRRFELSKTVGEDATELEIRNDEIEELIKTDYYNKSKLKIDKESVDSELSPFIDQLKRVSRITEVRALRGFTRSQPPDPFSSEKDQLSNVHYCRIGTGQNWLPAVENRGEGIFFSLNESELKKWEDIPLVKERFDAILEGLMDWARQRKWVPREHFKPRYVLLHTLAHLLIRELSLFSGYNAASIRERIYRNKTRNGIMLYTANPSADGSLGGLVRQGKSSNFKNLLKKAIRSSHRCSNDPLCAENNPLTKPKSVEEAMTRINGSACYACVLVPETSCENSNRLLDRQMIHNPDYGFFRKVKW